MMEAQPSPVVPFDEPGLARALAAHDLLLVAFRAPWCGPCQAFAPVFERVARQIPEVRFGSIDIERQPALAARFGVRSIPTLMGVREGVVLYLQAGALAAHDLAALVAHLRAVDMQAVHAALASVTDEAAE